MQTENTETCILTPKPQISSYKTVCAKLGFIMCVYFICRIIAGYTMFLIYGLTDEIGVTAAYISRTVIQVMLVYMVPMLVTAILFKSFDYYAGKLGSLYKKPVRVARALGNFPAMYGLGQGVNFLTMLAFWAISSITQRLVGETGIEEFFEPIAVETPPNLIGALIMVFMVAIIAPVFEEIWVRGIIYDALKPYGSGMAIIISSILFGLMHGSIQMLFYTTALGFALGYVRYATNSLWGVTVLHIIFNAVAAGAMFLMALTEFTLGENKLINTIYNTYLLAMLVLVFVGIAAFLRKIPVIRRYKISNAWNQISAGKKIALFFTSVPVIMMIILAINEHADNPLLIKIVENTVL